MEYVDYHVHSDNSFDGKFKIVDMCRKAASIGITEMCFTEHFCVDPKDVSYKFLNYNKYSDDIEKAREVLKGKLVIKKGLEIGEPYILKNTLSEEIAKMDLDFIIGSIHNINSFKLRLYMANKDKKYVYYDYFKEVLNMVQNSDIDVVGHLDLMKRYAYGVYGNYKFNDYKEILEEILKKVIENGIGIEVNASGFRNDVKESYPSIDILQLYKNLGGEILTIGSDSHDLENIGNGYLKVIKMLNEIGFKYIYKYNKRKKIAIKIEN